MFVCTCHTGRMHSLEDSSMICIILGWSSMKELAGCSSMTSQPMHNPKIINMAERAVIVFASRTSLFRSFPSGLLMVRSEVAALIITQLLQTVAKWSRQRRLACGGCLARAPHTTFKRQTFIKLFGLSQAWTKVRAQVPTQVRTHPRTWDPTKHRIRTTSDGRFLNREHIKGFWASTTHT